VVVQNAGRYNLNLTLSVPQNVAKQPENQGMIVGKDKTTVWVPPSSHGHDSLFREFKAKHPELSDEIIRDLALDYQFSPPQMKDSLLQLNVVSLKTQSIIIEHEKTQKKWTYTQISDNKNDEDDEDDEIDENLLRQVERLNVRAQALLGH